MSSRDGLPRPDNTVVVLFGLSLAGALLGKDSFLENYTDFILLLLYVLVPWTAINLVDYYLLRHGQYDVPSFFRRDGGIYGRVNAVAVEWYVIGIVVQLPLVATPLYTGPIARAIELKHRKPLRRHSRAGTVGARSGDRARYSAAESRTASRLVTHDDSGFCDRNRTSGR